MLEEAKALDFLNKESFRQNIFTVDKKRLFASGDKITPEILLRLYFKKIYIEPEEELQVQTSATPLGESVSADMESAGEGAGALEAKDEDEGEGEGKGEVKLEDVEENQGIFNKIQADSVRNYSGKLAEWMYMDPIDVNNIKIAGFIHDIGDKLLTTTDCDNYFQKRAELGYEYAKGELHYSENVAIVTKDYRKDYSVNDFDIKTQALNKMSYSHIVAISSYYVKRREKGQSKDAVLNEMRRLGGQKFNIYILHRFIQKMKEQNNDN